MKRACLLMLTLCLGALSVSAEETPAEKQILDLPALDPSGSTSKITGQLFQPDHTDASLPESSAFSHPRPATTGTAGKNKDWLVNGIMELQKKQQEEKNLSRQKQREQTNQFLQQEFERQQKALTLSNTNPFDHSKAANPMFSGSGPSTSQLNFPNGRLSLSGSNSIINLPELSQPRQNPLPFTDTSNGQPDASHYNPAQPHNKPPSNTTPWNSISATPAPKTPSPASHQLPNPAIGLSAQPPASPIPTPPHTLTVMPSSFPTNNPARTGTPFSSTQAANFLKQLDRQKSPPPAAHRPTLRDLNSIPSPSDMRRF
ncbi:MAG: hypothetical protein LBD30_06805 [Verrucomicrobiales bacterium]|nr:hypothetical protein [Verrucomicrobiales bacterium]